MPDFYRGIDVDLDVRPYLDQLKPWCSFVGRYSKNLTAAEHEAITAAGMKTLLIYEGGADNCLGGSAQGINDGNHFLRQCEAQGFKPGLTSGVFPACDTDKPEDMSMADFLLNAENYWYGFSITVFPKGWLYMGGYAPGSLLTELTKHGLIYPWSAGAKGWSGTRDYDLNGPWSVNQGPELTSSGTWPSAEGHLAGVSPLEWPDIGTPYDPNVARTLAWAL